MSQQQILGIAPEIDEVRTDYGMHGRVLFDDLTFGDDCQGHFDDTASAQVDAALSADVSQLDVRVTGENQADPSN